MKTQKVEMKKMKMKVTKMKMQKIKKIIINTKKEENEDENENKNMLLEYIENVHDKLFKKYSQDKDFNSFIYQFDHATNKEHKEKLVKELKDMSSLANHYTQWEDDFREYKYKTFNIINAIDSFLDEYSKKWASDFNWREAVKDY